MATNFTAAELTTNNRAASWCVCQRPHQSYCTETPCDWGAAWPRPEDPLPSMAESPWMRAHQVERSQVYQAQLLAHARQLAARGPIAEIGVSRG